MGQATRLDQVPAHPAVAGRLVELAQDLTVLLDTSDAVTFVPETEPRFALDALIESATALAERADRYGRVAVHIPPRS